MSFKCWTPTVKIKKVNAAVVVTKCLFFFHHSSHSSHKMDFIFLSCDCARINYHVVPYTVPILGHEYVQIRTHFKEMILHGKFFCKTFYFFCSSVDLYPKISQDLQLSTCEKGGGFFNKKNLTTSIGYLIQVERESGPLQQHHIKSVLCSVGPVLSHQRQSCLAHPVFSTAAFSTGRQIRFQITHDPLALQILETDSASLHFRDAFTDEASTQFFLSRLRASTSHDRLAMLARKRWAHHSSRSMGTKSAQRESQHRTEELKNNLFYHWFILFMNYLTVTKLDLDL